MPYNGCVCLFVGRQFRLLAGGCARFGAGSAGATTVRVSFRVRPVAAGAGVRCGLRRDGRVSCGAVVAVLRVLRFRRGRTRRRTVRTLAAATCFALFLAYCPTDGNADHHEHAQYDYNNINRSHCHYLSSVLSSEFTSAAGSCTASSSCRLTSAVPATASAAFLSRLRL